MLLNVSWLKDLVPYEGSLDELANRLTMLGLEVEEHLQPYSYLNSVVAGFVQTCRPHPEADRLSVCQVDIGQGDPISVVCGAPNVRQGQFVAVAPIGASLPDGISVKKNKIRGVVSEGMICSEKELRLSEDHDGIMVLDGDHIPGLSLSKALEIDYDVFDVGITPNRGDCLSVLGLAREVAAFYNLPLKLPEIRFQETEKTGNDDLEIFIEDADDCPMYQARIIEDITVAKSPDWLRYRLLASGIRPINNIVDITNYVLQETGHPLHAFDGDLIRGKTIKVALASSGTRLKTLDGEKRSLTSEDLLIWDGQGPIAIAGVMGGQDSEINEQSRQVVLECAVFNPSRVRKTARRLGMSTEASYRFERGVDQYSADWPIDRAADLIQRYARGRVLNGRIKQEPKPLTWFKIPFRSAKARSLLALEVKDKSCAETLKRLGCRIENSQDQAWNITPPSYRFDLQREVDLIEEIARFHSFENIPTHIPKIAKSFESKDEAVEYLFDKPSYEFVRDVRYWALGVGLQEVVNFSFVGRSELERFGVSGREWVTIQNPLSADQDTLRPFLAPGLLQNLRLNIDQNNNNLRLFETACVFSKADEVDTLTREKSKLGILLHGKRHPEQWPWSRETIDYLDIKGLVEHFLSHHLIKNAEYSQRADHPYLDPAVDIHFQEDHVGEIGQLSAHLGKWYHARSSVWIAEIDLLTIYQIYQNALLEYKPWPKYPPVHRDMTLIAGSEIEYKDIISTINSSNIGYLEDIALQDLYVPEESTERHFTFRITYRHPQKTMTDKEVDKVHTKLGNILSRSLPIRFP